MRVVQRPGVRDFGIGNRSMGFGWDFHGAPGFLDRASPKLDLDGEMTVWWIFRKRQVFLLKFGSGM